MPCIKAESHISNVWYKKCGHTEAKLPKYVFAQEIMELTIKG